MTAYWRFGFRLCPTSGARGWLLAAALLCSLPALARAQDGHGGGSSPRELRRLAALEQRSESADATTWRGFDALSPEVQSALRSRNGTLSLPAFGTNVKVNNTAGDGASEAQYYSAVAGWGRFVVVVWFDSKGHDAPAGTPPTTDAGYAYSCDYGTTFTDAGNVPRGAANEQMGVPFVTHDGRGHFYMCAEADLGLSVSGVPSSYAEAFWKGEFDTTACTFSWQARQLLDASGNGNEGPDPGRIACDPTNDYVYLVHTYALAAADDAVHVMTSADGGTTWGSVVTVDSDLDGSDFPLHPDITVGVDHEVYLTWGNDFWFYYCDMRGTSSSSIHWAKSTNHGASWTSGNIAPLYTTFFSNGPVDRFGGHKTHPKIAVDWSAGPNRGNAYVTWTASGQWAAPSSATATVAEVENGVTLPTNPQTISLGNDVTGTCTNSSDVDWYKIHLNAGETLIARMEPNPWSCGTAATAGFTIRLHSDFSNPAAFAGDTLLQASNFTNYVTQVVFTTKVSGDYYLRISTFSTTPNVGYRMRTRAITITRPVQGGRDEGDVVLSRLPYGSASWSTPILVNGDGPAGYQETGQCINVDASGRIRVGWLDHRETESSPRIVGAAQLTDFYIGESDDGGLTFQAGQRVTDENGLYGNNIRSTLTQYGFHGEVRADGDHLFIVWDDQRLSTRLTESLNVMSVFADREAPRVTYLSGPPQGAWVTSVPLTIGWTGIDRRLGYAGNQYRWDLYSVASATVVASGAFSPDSAATLDSLKFANGDGQYQFRVYGRDAAGNEAVLATTRAFGLDRAAPAASFLSAPAEGSSTASTSQTITWTVSDGTSGSTTSAYSLDGGAYTAYSGTHSASLSGLSAGTHTIAVKVKDVAGNESAPITRSWFVDLTAPTVQITSGPTTGSLTTGGAVSFAYSGTDNHDPSNVLSFYWNLDGGADVFEPGGGTQLAGLADGPHMFSVRAVDQAGNQGSPATVRWIHTSETLEKSRKLLIIAGNSVYRYTVPAAGPPSLDLTVATGLAFPTFMTVSPLGELMVVNAGATNAGTGSILRYVNVLGTPAANGVITDINGNPSFDFSEPHGVEFRDGEMFLVNSSLNRINRFVFDYTGTAVGNGTITGFTTPLNSRCVTFGLTGNQMFVSEANQSSNQLNQFTFDAAGAATLIRQFGGSGLNYHGVVFAPWGELLVAAYGSNTIQRFTFDGSGVPTANGSISGNGLNGPGDMTFSAWGELFVSNNGASTVSRFTFDVAHNAIAAGTFAIPAAGAGLRFGLAKPPNVSFVAGPAENGNTNSQVTFQVSSTSEYPPVTYRYTLDGNPSVDTPDSAVSLFSLEEGSHTLIVKAIDAVGLERTITRTWTVDLTPPVIAFTSGHQDGSHTRVTHADFTWSVNDNAPGTTQSAYRLDEGAWSSFSTTAAASLTGLSEGSHRLEVQAVDAVGNQSYMACSFSTLGLAGWWVGDTAGDSWGVHDGVAKNGLQFGTGVRGAGFILDGINDYVEVPDAPDLVPGAGEMTVEAWLRSSGAQPGPRMLVSKWEAGGSGGPGAVPSGYQLSLTTGIPRIRIRSTNPIGNYVQLDGNANVANNTWHHIVATLDRIGTGNLNLYVDGSLVATTPVSGSIGDTDGLPDPLTIGASVDSATDARVRFSEGQIDEVAYSNRALTATEIATLYASNGRAPCTGGAARVFVVDLTAPQTTIVSGPADGATITTGTAAYTVAGTDNFTQPSDLVFYYQADGGGYTGPSYDGTVTFSNLTEGTHSFEIVAHDLADNVDPTPATRSVTVHLDAPSKFIVDGPDPWTQSTSASFTWDAISSQPSASIEYAWRLDNEPLSAYAHVTTASYSNLAEGAHIFRLRARDAYGLEDSTTFTWTIDFTPPDAIITAGPPAGGYSGTQDPQFQFSYGDNLSPPGTVQFSYSVDNGTFSLYSTTSLITLNGLDPGPHTIAVVAKDAAGNVDPTPATRAWTIDIVGPQTVITSGPADNVIVDVGTVSFGFTGSDDASPTPQIAFEYQRDGLGYTSPASVPSATLSSLGDGAHTFSVRAVDLAGNRDATPAERAFIVDALPPVISFDSGPAQGACITATSASVTWSATDVISAPAAIRFAWRLDTNGYTPFGTDQSASFASLSEGPHTVSVQAKDERDHVATAARAFRVDNTTPVVNLPTTLLLDGSTFRITCTGFDAGGITSFRVQVATAPDFANIVSDLGIGAAGTLDVTGTPGTTYFARALATDCAGNASGFSGPSNGAAILNLPDLLVTSVQAPGAATSGAVLGVQFTVSNQAVGGTNAPQWSDDIYLSPTPGFNPGTAIFLSRITNLTFLSPNESYTVPANVTIPLAVSGTHYIVVVADALNQVPETNGANNAAASSAVAVTLGDYADLQVTQVVAPPNALSSDLVEIRWTVENEGVGRTNTDNWFDTIFYSDDPVFDYILDGGGGIKPLDTPVGTFHHIGALEPGQDYTRIEHARVPDGVSGPKYFIVASDLRLDAPGLTTPERGAVFENFTELNATTADPTDVTLQLPSDLVAQQVTVSATAASGGPITFDWTVANQGFNTTPGVVWVDQVFLSSDLVLDGSDLNLGVFGHSGDVPIGQDYSNSVTVTLPVGISGTYSAFLRADAYSNVGELLETNNIAVSQAPVAITLSPWPDLAVAGVSVPASVLAGQVAAVSWRVTNEGIAPATGGWTDDVWIAPGAGSLSGGMVVAATRNPQPLGSVEDYTGQATFAMPVGISGDWHVYVNTDAHAEVYEHGDESNNLGEIGVIHVNPYPPVDVAVTAVSAPSVASGGGPLTVTWTLQNLGQAQTTAGAWNEELWLSADATLDGGDTYLTTTTHGGVLAAGETYTRAYTVTLSRSLSGPYHPIVRTQPAALDDQNTSNDVRAAASPVTITQDPAPDLAASAVTASANVVSGQPIAIDWTLDNTGPGPATGTWFSNGYLSHDLYLDSGDILLGSFQGPASVASASSVPQHLDATVPNWATGAYYVIVLDDSRNDIYEAGSEANNVAISAPVFVTLPDPADLVVQNIVVPPVATPGEPVTITYTIANVGVNPAVGQIQNAVYMSSDNVFLSTQDPLVGIETQTVNIPPGGHTQMAMRVVLDRPIEVSQAGAVTAELPPLSPGNYFAIVRANIRSSIRELDFSNDEAASPTTLAADVAALTLGVPVDFPLQRMQARFYKVTVADGLDLTFRLTTNVPDATNEVYVAFGRAPTLSDFDFTGPAEFTASPTVLVPGTQAGTYYVMVLARDLGLLNFTQTGTLIAETLPFSITQFSPEAGGQGGRVTVRLRGAGFRPFTQVRLEQGGLPAATASLAKFTNSTDILARFDLAGVPTGAYDLVATNGIESVVAPRPFAVEDPRVIAVQIGAQNQDVLRRTATGAFDLSFTNTSNQDVPVLRARVLFPASSILKSIETGPGLYSRSELMPARFAPIAGDVDIVHALDRDDSLAIVDLVGTNLSPGETRRVTVGVAGFATSPFSVRAMAEGSELQAFLDREVARDEAARLALLASPAGVPGEALALASDPFAFRDAALDGNFVDTGLLSAADVLAYLTALPPNTLPSPVAPGPTGPQVLLDEAATSSNCVPPSAVPDCQPDVSVAGSALPGCVVVFPAREEVAINVAGGVTADIAGSVVGGYSATLSANAKIVAPCDPNILTGPAGYGDQHWVNAANAMPYTVNFENLPGVASAPAQVVKVSVPLDSTLEATTFRLGNLGFSGHTIGVPSDRTSFSTEPFFSDVGLRVRIVCGIDLATRTANWTFTSIDPNTGQQPTNPFIGFLPVNNTSGLGQGFVTYSVRPIVAGGSGSIVRAKGAIIFDANAPIPTAEASNRVDRRSPTSKVLQSQVIDSTQVSLNWSGSDDATGVGLEAFSLYMLQDSGPYSLVSSGLTGNGLTLPVAPGHRYAFYTLANDHTGNTEGTKIAPDVVVAAGTVGVPGHPTPRVTMLHPNAPNPFHAATRIHFELAQESGVSLEVFDIQGRLVKRLLDGKRFPAGDHSVMLERLPRAGVYFYRFRAGEYRAVRRLVML